MTFGDGMINIYDIDVLVPLMNVIEVRCSRSMTQKGPSVKTSLP